MVPAPFVVVVDANVLFPLTLRDTVLRAAAAGFYQLRWSAEILDEMERDLISKGRVAPDKAATGAQVIATSNLRDFVPLPAGIEAQSPDEFLCNLYDLDPSGFVEMLREQAADLVNPPVAFEDLLERLSRVVPDLIAAVRQHVKTAGAQ